MIRVDVDEKENETIYTLVKDGEVICTVGTRLTNYLINEYFVWIVPTLQFTPLHAKKIKAVMDECVGHAFFCNVEKKNKVAVRFAKFFGFKQVGDVDDILILGRTI